MDTSLIVLIPKPMGRSSLGFWGISSARACSSACMKRDYCHARLRICTQMPNGLLTHYLHGCAMRRWAGGKWWTCALCSTRRSPFSLRPCVAVCGSTVSGSEDPFTSTDNASPTTSGKKPTTLSGRLRSIEPCAPSIKPGTQSNSSAKSPGWSVMRYRFVVMAPSPLPNPTRYMKPSRANWHISSQRIGGGSPNAFGNCRGLEGRGLHDLLVPAREPKHGSGVVRKRRRRQDSFTESYQTQIRPGQPQRNSPAPLVCPGARTRPAAAATGPVSYETDGIRTRNLRIDSPVL